MNDKTFKTGFTLVEIMIVVVIIGLLAALAIPAFKKVRNNAIEKSMINDARQVSSAAQQYCTEQADRNVIGVRIAAFLNGGNFSSGVLIAPGITNGTFLAGGVYTLDMDGVVPYFTLTHPQYDRTLSSNSKIFSQTIAPNIHSIVFNTDDGQVQH